MQVLLKPYLLVAAVVSCLPVGCGKPDRTPDAATSNPDPQVTTGGPGAAVGGGSGA